jgi:predicted Zn-dependent protease with MMP-like domain
MQFTDEEFEDVVQDAIASIPEGFKHYLEEIAVDIEDEPDEATCREMKLRSPRQLLGLYRGTPLTRRNVHDSFRFPDRIVIYQRNLERMCRTREQMVAEIRKTVLHEVGHHFGLSERQLRDLGF